VHREQKMTKVTYICRGLKKKVVTCFISYIFSFFFGSFLSRFWAFRNKGDFINTKRKSRKIHLGTSQCFFCPLPWLFCSIFYYVFGRFVTRGAKKCTKKIAESFPQPPKKRRPKGVVQVRRRQASSRPAKPASFSS
jgi:hypothetical protein